MVKKKVKKILRKSKPRNLVLPILIFSVIATLSLALYLARPTPLQINEVAVVPSTCSNYVSGPNLPKTSFNPGEKITYGCAFTEPDINCNWGMVSEPRNVDSQKWLGWAEDHKTSNFESYVPRIPGTYTAYCLLGSTPECAAKGVAACNAKDKSFIYTVVGDPVPEPTNLQSQCLDNGKKVKITWDAVTGALGYLPRLDNMGNDVTGKSWNLDNTDYIIDHYTITTLEKDVVPNNKYDFWIHTEGPNGSISEPSNITFTCSNLTCKDGFTDSFDSSNTQYTYSTSNTIQNGQAIFSGSGRLITNLYNGDFVATLDISSSNSNSANPVILARNFDDARSRAVKLQFRSGKVETARYSMPDGKTDNFEDWKSATIDNSTKLAGYKIERKGSTFRTYYKTTSSDYKLLGSYDNITNDPVSIRFGSDNAEKTSFDSFSLNCGASAAPTNLRSTCNPDGKSVKLMWDTVNDAQSYKVRIDDKAGKILSFDNVGKGEYIATISPNTIYSWWAHATKDGVDSAETPRLEFKCVPTSTPTPTPKPTVKPTPKPTAESTISPTQTPTTQKISIPAEPISTPIPTKSNNPISRFFSWLASLFE